MANPVVNRTYKLRFQVPSGPLEIRGQTPVCVDASQLFRFHGSAKKPGNYTKPASVNSSFVSA